ncbi:MAG: nucleoside hydrolase [Candidatus Methylacidiphilales bacterium]|nr:nucleoside hydrolase [Candidatus Methylacidiphilales bacterium]
MPQKVLIDTDPGQDIDDLLALHFALLRPELDIRAITAATWPTPGRARLVKRLLRYMGREGTIPVAAGMDLPLRAVDPDELAWLHRLDNSMNHRSFAEPHDPRDEADPVDAVDLIIRTVEAHPGEVALLCIAPLTNIACALQRKPEIVAKIPYIAMMGGETERNRAEHNVQFDYVAADIVLRSGIPVMMGTWDVTRRFTLSLSRDCEQLAAQSAPVCKALADAIHVWHPAQSWKPGPVMYDIFPILYAIDPAKYYTLETASIRVETCGQHTIGYTVRSGSAKHIKVTTECNVEAVREIYMKTVLA